MIGLTINMIGQHFYDIAITFRAILDTGLEALPWAHNSTLRYVC